MSSRQPVLIGVGDIVNRSRRPEDAVEPLNLILSAIESALQDTGVSKASIQELQNNIDSVNVVRTWTWPYPDLAALVAAGMGISPKHIKYSEHGGHSPVLLLDEAARRISLGESNVAVVTGAEALASCKVEGLFFSKDTDARQYQHVHLQARCRLHPGHRLSRKSNQLSRQRRGSSKQVRLVFSHDFCF